MKKLFLFFIIALLSTTFYLQSSSSKNLLKDSTGPNKFHPQTKAHPAPGSPRVHQKYNVQFDNHNVPQFGTHIAGQKHVPQNPNNVSGMKTYIHTNKSKKKIDEEENKRIPSSKRSTTTQVKFHPDFDISINEYLECVEDLKCHSFTCPPNVLFGFMMLPWQTQCQNDLQAYMKCFSNNNVCQVAEELMNNNNITESMPTQFYDCQQICGPKSILLSGQPQNYPFIYACFAKCADMI